MLLFREMRVTRKFFLGSPQIYFFNWFSGDILFSSLISFVFFVFLFSFCSFVFFFEIENIYSDTHLTMRGWVIEKFSPGRFPETKLLFFGLKILNRKISSSSINGRCIFNTLCLGKYNWRTTKLLKIKIASLCELFQNRFLF